MSAPAPAAGASVITASRSRASIAWIRPSRNDCSSRAAWYSAFSLRSPSSFAVRIRAMTSGRLTLVSSSSSACSRVGTFGGQRITDGRPPAARGVAGRGDRRPPARRRAPRRRFAPAARLARPRHRRPARRRPASAAGGGSRLRQERSGEPGRLAARPSAGAGSPTAGRRPGPAGPRPLAGRDPLGERVEQRVLVFLDGVGRRPPDPRRRADRSVCSQWPPECGRRSPSAVRCIAATRPLIERRRRPT